MLLGVETVSAKRESQISLEVQRIEKNIQVIKDALTALEERISSVIVPSYPTPNSGLCEKTADRPMVPLAGDLKSINVELAEISSRLFQFKDRCEL